MKILDCTLRDGGYYNQWMFSKAFIQTYLKTMELAKIDIVEIGLRIPASVETGSLGPVAYTTEGFLNDLEIPTSLLLGVMINAKDYNSAMDIESYFVAASESKVGLVRIASHFHEIEKSLELATVLKKLGYIVGLNLMQITMQTSESISSFAKIISKSSSLDVLYFADSLGNMNEDNVKETISTLREYYKGELGIHAHNNMSKALSNTLFSYDNGVTWLDCTVCGMGRGAGNTETELLLTEINDIENRFDTHHLYSYVINEFQALKREYNWGPDLFYYIAGKYSIHPSYVQELKSQGVQDAHDLLNALDVLKTIESSSFKKLNLNELIYTLNKDEDHGVITQLPKINSDVLLVANGNEANKIQRELMRLAKSKNLFVISLNISNFLKTNDIDMLMMCNPARILSSLDKLKDYSGKAILPVRNMKKSLRSKLNEYGVYNYDLTISNEISFSEEGCHLNSPLVLAYALSFVLSQRVGKIYFAGFDGYSGDDQKNNEIRELINTFKKISPECELMAITAGKLGIKEESIYKKGMLYEI